MKQPNDSHIGWQVLTRNFDQIGTIVADEAFDCDDLRQRLRENGVQPVTQHKEFHNPDKAHNAQRDDGVYHLRSNVESGVLRNQASTQ